MSRPPDPIPPDEPSPSATPAGPARLPAETPPSREHAAAASDDPGRGPIPLVPLEGEGEHGTEEPHLDAFGRRIPAQPRRVSEGSSLDEGLPPDWEAAAQTHRPGAAPAGTYSALRGPALRLAPDQRELLRDGLRGLHELLATEEPVWHDALEQAAVAERELNLEHFEADFALWMANLAALGKGGWWMLQPRCSAVELRVSICERLRVPFLEHHPRYSRLTGALMMGRYPAIARLISVTESIRTMLTLHIRER